MNKKSIPQVFRKLSGLLAAGLLTVAANGAVAETDFSGLWMPSFGPGNGQTPAETPYTDFALKLREDYLASFGVADDPGGFCIKPGLIRSIWGAPFPVEIIQTDAFINMFWEGYFQYRKIYMEGYDRPEPILHSRMGYSVGHWEGDVLVVETTYLREYPYMRRLSNTDDATIVERMTIEVRPDRNGNDSKFLVNELTLTDSKIYTEPVIVTGTLSYSPDTPIMEYSCSEGLYDQYLEGKGLQVPDLSQ